MATAPPGAPPGGPPGPFRSNRCAWCGGELSDTEVAGQPEEEDHMEGCEFFARADQTMRYAKELQRAASKPTARDASRKVRRYLQKGAKELSKAACADNPVLAVERLAGQYAVEYEKGTKQAATAQILMEACRALAQGKNPAPITSVPK